MFVSSLGEFRRKICGSRESLNLFVDTVRSSVLESLPAISGIGELWEDVLGKAISDEIEKKLSQSNTTCVWRTDNVNMVMVTIYEGNLVMNAYIQYKGGFIEILWMAFFSSAESIVFNEFISG